MSNDLNQCNFVGRLGKDVDMRYLPSGDAVAGFSIAVGSQWKDKQGQKQEATEWVSVTAFGKLGEICGKYLQKGSQVFVSGRMKTDKYEKDGMERYSTKIIADRMQMLCGKPDTGNPASSASVGHRPAPSGKETGNFDDMDSDSIPF